MLVGGILGYSVYTAVFYAYAYNEMRDKNQILRAELIRFSTVFYGIVTAIDANNRSITVTSYNRYTGTGTVDYTLRLPTDSVIYSQYLSQQGDYVTGVSQTKPERFESITVGMRAKYLVINGEVHFLVFGDPL